MYTLMRKSLRVVYIFICSMGHFFFEFEGIACFDAAQRHAGGRVAAALTDRSKCGSRKDSTPICGENNLLGYQHEITVVAKGRGTSASKTRTTDRLILGMLS